MSTDGRNDNDGVMIKLPASWSGFLALRPGLGTGAVVTAALLWSAVAQSAAINLPPPHVGDVDITTFGASLTYTYSPICANSKGQTGTCGSKYTIPRWDLTSGTLKITGKTMVLDPDSGGPTAPYNVTNGNYSFTAKFGFNSTGTALVLKIANDVPDDLVVTGNTTAPGFAGPNLLTGEIADATTVTFGGGPWSAPFGYAGSKNASGNTSAGIFEFVLLNLTGDVAATGGIAYLVASTSSLVHPLLPSGTKAGTTFDSLGINFWKKSFSASNVRVDTYVPLPAALVLFGSALAAFFGLRRRQMTA
jgi:hypothetical protein